MGLQTINLSKRNQRHKIYLNLWKNLTGSKQLLMLLYSLIIRLNSVLDPSLISNKYNPLGCEERSTKTMFS